MAESLRGLSLCVLRGFDLGRHTGFRRVHNVGAPLAVVFFGCTAIVQVPWLFDKEAVDVSFFITQVPFDALPF
jgi:hypothetical protein